MDGLALDNKGTMLIIHGGHKMIQEGTKEPTLCRALSVQLTKDPEIQALNMLAQVMEHWRNTMGTMGEYMSRAEIQEMQRRIALWFYERYDREIT